MPVLFIKLLNTSPFEAGCHPPARATYIYIYTTFILLHTCGVCITSVPCSAESYTQACVELLVLQLTSTRLIGTSLTYLSRFHAID